MPRRKGEGAQAAQAISLRVMGLDLSLTATGLVVCEGTTPVLEVVIKTNSDEYRGEWDSNQRRIARITDGIALHIEEQEPYRIGIENAAFGAKRSDTRPHEVSGVVKQRLWEAEFVFELVSTTSIKMLATGNGRASKRDMVLAAQQCGVQSKDNNVADAYWVAQEILSRHT